MSYKKAFFIALALLLISNVYWVYVFIDSAISYSYLKDSYNWESRTNSILGEIITNEGSEYSQQDVLHLLRQAYPEGFIVEEGNTIYMDGVKFEFSDNRLSNVGSRQ